MGFPARLLLSAWPQLRELRMTPSSSAEAQRWDRRYREGRDGWELGQPAPPLERFLLHHQLAPRPPGRVLVPGCGRGHEVALLAEAGFNAVGLDLSALALEEARRRHGPDRPGLQWLQADLLDPPALEQTGLAAASLAGVLEHTCFCAIHPAQRPSYAHTIARLLRPGGWLLGLFWCHGRPGGPPWGSDPEAIAALFAGAGLVQQLWQPAEGSVPQRQQEWLGLWSH